jgi:hypothetical protein
MSLSGHEKNDTSVSPVAPSGENGRIAMLFRRQLEHQAREGNLRFLVPGMEQEMINQMTSTMQSSLDISLRVWGTITPSLTTSSGQTQILHHGPVTPLAPDFISGVGPSQCAMVATTKDQHSQQLMVMDQNPAVNLHMGSGAQFAMVSSPMPGRFSYVQDGGNPFIYNTVVPYSGNSFPGCYSNMDFLSNESVNGKFYNQPGGDSHDMQDPS